MKKLPQLVLREFQYFWQNKVFVFAFLVMPLILGSILGFVYTDGRLTQLPIVVVDRDHSPMSAKYIQALSENNTLHVSVVKTETVRTEEEMISSGAVAVVTIPDRFGADLINKRRPEVNCYVNSSNTLTAGAAGSAVQLCTAMMNVSAMITAQEKKTGPIAASMPQYESFHSNTFQQFNPSGNYLYFLWPGFIFSLLQQLLLLASAPGFAREFEGGSFNSNGVLGYTRAAPVLILAKILPCILLSAVTVTVYLLLSLSFRVPLPTHPAALIGPFFLMVTGASLLGTVFSILMPLPLKSSQTLMSVSTPAFGLSGFSWPYEQLPVALQLLSDIIPLTPFLRIVRLVWIEGASLAQIHPQLTHQLILVIVYFLISLLLLRKKIAVATDPAASRGNKNK